MYVIGRNENFKKKMIVVGDFFVEFSMYNLMKGGESYGLPRPKGLAMTGALQKHGHNSVGARLCTIFCTLRSWRHY